MFQPLANLILASEKQFSDPKEEYKTQVHLGEDKIR